MSMKAKKPASQHVHQWQAHIRFKCRCGVTHSDPIAIGENGQVFIARTDGCARVPKKKTR